MKKSDINLFANCLKVVISYDINKLFEKTELVNTIEKVKKENSDGAEETEEFEGKVIQVYKRKYNKNLSIIKTTINKEDDDTQLFLNTFKTIVNDFTPSQEDMLILKKIFFADEDWDNVKDKIYIFCLDGRDLINSYKVSEETIKSIAKFFNVTIDD